MDYNFSEIEAKWQAYWAANKTFAASNSSDLPKYYALDMFPYPSGAGLHVGHPLGYIASDIVSRYKRHKGFNVLHPMGYDAYGLPAEQYAIQTGQHPDITTKANIATYRRQLDLIGFSFDWDREVRTCEPGYYKWTQWVFKQLFNAWYNNAANKAEPIDTLIAAFAANGNANLDAACAEVDEFSAADWNSWNEEQQQTMLLNYRLAYLSDAMVNWCPDLGTVLANEEVVNGVSERGGYPVERKTMRQWSLRITAYSDRLLDGLNTIDWTDSLKEQQRNWIGRSEGASIRFALDGHSEHIEVFTTRPDTIFGATFMVLAPELELVNRITTAEQKAEVDAYVEQAKNRSDLDRMADVKTVSGVFTGAHVLHPFSGEKVPVWVGDYVLAGYGTGAVMAVPSGDQRDWNFATHFGLPIVPVLEGQDCSEGADEVKDNTRTMINSGFLNGLAVPEAVKAALAAVEEKNIGERKVNFKFRDAIFSRQRYWGEPFPIYYKNDLPYALDDDQLPLQLPEVDEYLPTRDGEPPLARAKNWVTADGHPLETNTMPGWAGSSWYFLRYMDPGNTEAFASREATDYWGNVDLYLGGSEHATGHLLYVRFWTKFLYDLGYIGVDEPAKKLINQGMIQAEDGQKMSKRYGNVVNPDDVCEQYGADTLRLHEMFLGPLEQHKPWNTKGIEGVHRFLRKLWRLYTDKDNNFDVSDEAPTSKELKSLHKTIKKAAEDIERYSFNTSVSAFMVCVNELTEQECNKRAILEPLAIILSPYAPHIAEELWEKLGHSGGIARVPFPEHNEEYLVEDVVEMPIQFNGKVRFRLAFAKTMSKADIEAEVLAHETSQKWLEGKAPRKVIVVPGRIVNVVV